MKSTLFCLFVLAPLSLVFAAENSSQAKPDAEAKKYLLRYKFQPGETIRWDVEHRAHIRTTVSGTTQTAETVSKSTKVWRVLEVNEQGDATFEHSVSNVDMRQQLTGRQELRYNSETDKEPPAGFQDVAKSVGVPLSIITIDALGAIKHREEKRPNPPESSGQITVPLPEEPVAVGAMWSHPHDVSVSLGPNGGFKSISTRQRFSLESVENGIATIKVETQILTPVNDPAIEAQLIQRYSQGEVRFDIALGRVIGQQMDLDRNVIGFQGEASSMHYVTRFVERLMHDDARPFAEQKVAAATKKAPKKEKPNDAAKVATKKDAPKKAPSSTAESASSAKADNSSPDAEQTPRSAARKPREPMFRR